MTYAVIRYGGRQFKVSEGEKFETMRQSSTDNEVLMYSDGKDVVIGEPVLTDYEVKLTKVEDKRAKKIRVGRFKSKSRYRKVKGHKQPMSVLMVDKIGKKGKKVEKKVEEKEEAKVDKKADTKAEKKVVKAAPKKRGRPAKKQEELK